MRSGSPSCFTQTIGQDYRPFLNVGHAGEEEVPQDNLKGVDRARDAILRELGGWMLATRVPESLSTGGLLKTWKGLRGQSFPHYSGPPTNVGPAIIVLVAKPS